MSIKYQEFIVKCGLEEEMRVAIVGSRSLSIDISQYIPEGMEEIISGGALGIDCIAQRYADENHIPKLIIRPDYPRYGRAAPYERNKIIAQCADMVLAIWDGKSKGTKQIISYARQIGKPVKVVLISPNSQSEQML